MAEKNELQFRDFEGFINAKFEISMLVYLEYPLEAGFWVHYTVLIFCLPIFVNNMRNSKSAYLFTYNTRRKLASEFILDF